MPPILDDKKRMLRHQVLSAALAGAGLLITATAVPAADPAAEAASPPPAAAEQKAAAEKNAVVKTSARQVEKKLEIVISCAKPPVHTAYELPGSGRSGIVVDLAEVELKEPGALKLPDEFKVGITAEAVRESGQGLLRVKLALPKPYASYAASRQENDVVVTVDDFFQDTQAAAVAAPPAPPEKAQAEAPPPPAPALPEKSPAAAAPPAAPKEGQQKDAVVDSQLLSVKPPPAVAAAAGSSAAAAPQSFSTTGYDSGKLITVDFFKIDLHNVFRLLGEVSGANIVVSEGVAGTLTLSLHEVPWDFALDIIVNLKELAKEQRHNTIVIYPKNKEFVWPERAGELTIEEVGKGSGGKGGAGAIVIGPGEQMQVPELTEAKKFSAQGILLEKQGNLEAAVQLYEKALDAWPDGKADKEEKSRLANKIAAIYLAGLNQNAKAVYFAKKALAADKKNSAAALNAAIGHANMEENGQAQQYFDQSVSIGGKPSPEALLNYAVFSERQQQYDAAVRLLSKYSELYGENLESMVSRARILDKQGQRAEADKVYLAILHAGFQVPFDLKEFISNRTSSNSR